jgi:hypothetical protein
MHRIYLQIQDEKTWYSVMAEARSWFGKNWKCQPRVRRRFRQFQHNWNLVGTSIVPTEITVWFEVPNLQFETWAVIKCGVRRAKLTNK